MRFVIIAHPRTGTHMLTTFLNSHSGIKCYAEEDWDFIKKLKDQEGANIKYGNIPKKADFYNFKIIHLIRKNLLELAVSNVINRHKDKYGRPAHIFPGSNLKDTELYISKDNSQRDKYLEYLPNSVKSKVSTDKIYLDKKEVVRTMKEASRKVCKWHEKLKNNSFTVFYEDICNNEEIFKMPMSISDKLCDYLDLERQILRTKMSKVNRKNYKDYIENWVDIRNLEKSLAKEYEKFVIE